MSVEKAFKPTQRKLEHARREGKVLKSRALTLFAAAFAATVAFSWSISSIWVAVEMLLEYAFDDPSRDLTPTILAAIMYLKSLMFRTVGLVCAASCAAAISSEILQIGFKVEPGPLRFDSARLNPLAGFKRMVSSVQQLWEHLVCVTAVAAAGSYELWKALPQFERMQENGAAALPLACPIVLRLIAILLTVSGLWAAVDYFLRRRTFYRELSMTHLEMREEHKHHEGSPLMKNIRRAMHESIAMQDLEKRVRQSKVLIVAKRERTT